MKKINIFILLIIATVSVESIAADCEQVIEGNDALQFNSKTMTVSASCETVTLTLKHTGQLPANIMGHNWVLTKSSDFMPVAQAGGSAGNSPKGFAEDTHKQRPQLFKKCCDIN